MSKLSFFKRSSVAARALRQVLKEDARVEAEKRGEMALRYQIWKDGKAGDQTWIKPPPEEK